jgi:hypothetical protein
MATNRITTTLAAVNGVDYAVLTGKSDVFPYENGKKSSETRIGVKLNIALQNARLEQLAVKFSADPLPNMSDEQIAVACAECKFMYVQIPNCEVVLYSSSNGIGMTATASSAKIVAINSSNLKINSNNQ